MSPSSASRTGILLRSALGWPHWATIATLIVLALSPRSTFGYIPAQGTNDTTVAQQAGQNFSDASKLSLQWYPMGSYTEQISYQLVGADSTGINKGALVHFSEDKMPNGTTTTPWIALVSCDTNSTNASMEDDIFTLARDRGAVAALLYSLKSVTCYINPEYSDPANFDQVMDIFATQSLSSSSLIENQFTTILGNSSSKYYWFSPTLLNSSQNVIESAIANHAVPSAGYLFATLTASNATDPSANTTGTGSTTTSSDGSNNSSGGSTNTSLAMIILYAITGCVSALFCIVIVSGAIRAIRHPERYGPRSGDTLGPPGALGAQSRARGLTRAILDTFPVVKFGRTDADLPEAPAPAKDLESVDYTTAPTPAIRPGMREGRGKAVEAGDGSEEVALELREWTVVAARLGDEDKPGPDAAVLGPIAIPTLPHTSPGAGGAEDEDDQSPRAGSSSSVPQVVPRPPKAPAPADASGSGNGNGEKDVVPDAIGRETCPICIVDFEEGDDLRILPCEGHHRFHQECVDQWLLELSSSCPLCRQDFQALQTMMTAGEEADHLEPPHVLGSARPMSSAAARFSRYLRTARRRRQRRAHEDQGGYDPTNPPVPIAPRTTLHM
ncbi:hypothetical protein BD310DRAFT_956809 [Dichomitus squalens]|uniref:RING-type domain-containing protein n=1 Tax=Dichomitus squalens TaxID=114155 RepID=A0A4V2K8W7_9APHY|nr:hypothetical protein BD310DRAFT_956809 [Dichomitus squalens]